MPQYGGPARARRIRTARRDTTRSEVDKTLTPAQRQALKARAHALDPVVMIGNEGLTDAVVSEIERALTAHELIKIRAAGAERAERDALMAEIGARTGAAPVQRIGRVLVLFRERPEPPPAPAPVARRAAGRKPAGKPGRRSASARPAAKRGSNRPPPRRAKIRSR